MNSATAQSTGQQGLRRPLAWVVWSLAVTYVVYKFQTQSSYAVLNADIAESLSLTLLQVGELGAVYAITYAVMTIPAGGLLDRYGARMILSAAVIITGQALMGIGGAFGYPGLAYLTRYWFDIRHFGLVFGVAQTVAATANTLGQAAVGYLILVMAWQDIMLLEALIGLLLLVAFVLLVREPDDDQDKTSRPGMHPPFWAGLWRDLRVLSVRPLFWQVTLISGLTFGLMLGVGIIWGIKLLIFKGFDPTSASNINATIWFGFGTGALLVHVLSDYVRSFKLTCVVFLVCDLIALLLFILLSDISTGVAYMLFLSIGFFAGVSPMCYTMTTRFCEKARAGTAFGLLTCVSFVIGALLMPAPARLIEDFNVPVNMAAMIFPAALVLALILSVIKQETYDMAPAA